MRNSKAFSLIEVMVVLMITSIIAGIVYQLVAIGVRFFENFSRFSDFSVKNFVKDVEFEMNLSYDFKIKNNTLWIFQEGREVKYSPFKIEKNFSYLILKKETIESTKVSTKMFKLNNAISIIFHEYKKEGNRKVFLVVQDVKGDEVYEGYLP